MKGITSRLILGIVCLLSVSLSPLAMGTAQAATPTIRAYANCYGVGAPRTYSYNAIAIDLRASTEYTLRWDVRLFYPDGTSKLLSNTTPGNYTTNRDGTLATGDHNGYGTVSRVEATVRVYRTSNGNYIGVDTGACNH
jgi:hypothetical protein